MSAPVMSPRGSALVRAYYDAARGLAIIDASESRLALVARSQQSARLRGTFEALEAYIADLEAAQEQALSNGDF